MPRIRSLECAHMNEDRPILRPAARVLVIDEQSRLLLFRLNTGDRDVWIVPGGTVEPGETPEQTASRKLWEETGIEYIDLSPCVWTRRHVVAWGGKTYEQDERFYVARTPTEEITLDNIGAEELVLLREWRWWTVEEIERSDALFAPRKLAKILPAILATDYPDEPIVLDS